MCDAAAEAGLGWVLGEGEDVVPTRSLSVNESISTPVLTQTKDLLVEPQRASQVSDGEIDVRKAVSLNHNYLEILSRSNGKAHRPPLARSAEREMHAGVASQNWAEKRDGGSGAAI